MSAKSNHILKSERYNGSFLVAHVADEVVTGQIVEELPCHITLAATIETLGYRAVHAFYETLPDIAALEAHVGKREFGRVDYFGEQNDVMVRPIVGEGALSLMAMHVLFLARFRPYMSDLTYAGQRYRPHMTIKSEEDDPGEGAAINVDSACLLRKREEGGWLIYQADKIKNAKQE